MNKKEIITDLIRYGLTAHEASVYFAIVELLEGSVTQIARQSHLPRSTVQTVLERLRERGLTDRFHKNNVLYYSTTSLSFLGQSAQQRVDIAQELTPFLQQISRSSGTGSSMRMVTGIDGIKGIFNDMLSLYKYGATEVYAISNLDTLHALLPKFFPDWARKEALYPVNVSMMIHQNNKVHKNTLDNPRMKLRRIAGDAYPGDMTIIGTRVIFFYLEKKNPHAYVVDSREVAEMQRRIFQLAWRGAED